MRVAASPFNTLLLAAVAVAAVRLVVVVARAVFAKRRRIQSVWRRITLSLLARAVTVALALLAQVEMA